MDDDSCVTKSTEIVPDDNYRNCSESSDDVKLSPSHIKVCTIFIRVCIVTSFAFELLN